MNPYIKNTLLLLLVAILGALLGLGGSKLLAMLNKKPEVQVETQTIKPMSQEEALKQVDYEVLVPTFFKNKKVLYYLFPDKQFKIDFLEKSTSQKPSSLDVMPMGKSDSNEKPTGKSFPFVHGTAYINKGTESYILSFTKNKVYYQLAVQNSILPKDEAKAMEELKKIAASFQLVTR